MVELPGIEPAVTVPPDLVHQKYRWRANSDGEIRVVELIDRCANRVPLVPDLPISL